MRVGGVVVAEWGGWAFQKNKTKKAVHTLRTHGFLG